MMKGIVFNLFEECVSRKFGEETWDTLLDTAALEGAYTSLATYPDEQLYALADAASVVLKLSTEQVIR
jgi:Haem-NO-binding